MAGLLFMSIMRCLKSNITLDRLVAVLVVCLAPGLLGLGPITAAAQADNAAEVSSDSAPLYTVTIEQLLVDDMRVNDTLSVFLRTDGVPLAGFDLKLATVGDFFQIVEVLPGEIHDSCNWEFFNARRAQGVAVDGKPVSIWQTVALAEMLSGKGGPACFGLEREASLLKLVVTSEFGSLVPDTALPIFFIWEDCSDNTISGKGGDTLALSRRVIDYYQSEAHITGNPFPTVTGAPRDCIKAGTINRPQRRVDFINGGIEFRLRVEPDSISSGTTAE